MSAVSDSGSSELLFSLHFQSTGIAISLVEHLTKVEHRLGDRGTSYLMISTGNRNQSRSHLDHFATAERD